VSLRRARDRDRIRRRHRQADLWQPGEGHIPPRRLLVHSKPFVVTAPAIANPPCDPEFFSGSQGNKNPPASRPSSTQFSTQIKPIEVSRGIDRLPGVRSSGFHRSQRLSRYIQRVWFVGSRVKISHGVNTPWHPPGFSCFVMTMSERRCIRRPLAAAIRPAPDLNRATIKIHWGEATAETIEIRRHPGGLITKLWGFKHSGMASNCRRGHAAQVVLSIRTQNYFASQLGRGVV